MTRKSVRARGLMLLAASLAFAACAPLPTADSDPKPTTTSKKKASPSPSASASTAASASPSPSVSATPSLSPSVSPSPSPVASASASASPSPSPSPLTLASDEAGGLVYDEKGTLVTSGKIHVLSLTASKAFDKTVDITNGKWVVEDVPSAAQLSLTVTREGWTSRRRIEVKPGDSAGLEVNFGGPATTGDADGPAFYVSDYPEIVAIEPADGAAAFDPTQLALTLKVSEALDVTNQRRLSKALLIFPGNQAAAGGHGTLDTNFLDADEQSTPAAQPFKVTDAVYALGEDSMYLGLDDGVPNVEWNALGTEMTFTFNGPLLRTEDDAAMYSVALFSEGVKIEDKSGKGLGTDETGVLDTTPGSGELIYFTFQEASLQVPSGTAAPAAAAKRWQATHDNFTTFELPADEMDPVLTSVTVTPLISNDGPGTRISLSFSEPMVAFGGGNIGVLGFIEGVRQFSGDTLSADESGVFSFAVAETTADLEDITMEGFPADVAAAPWGDSADEREVEFKLDAPRLSVNPSDPTVLRLEVSGNLFADNVIAIRAYVEGISDPAGNAITESSAEQNTKIGNI